MKLIKLFLPVAMMLSICHTVSAADAIEVSKSTVLKADIQKIWRWTGGFCAIKGWHPAVDKCDITMNGDAEFRTLTLGDGGQIKEKYTGGSVYGYHYIITESPLPVKDYSATFKAEKVNEGVKLTWSAKFLSHGKSDAEAEAVIAGILESGLATISEKFKNRKNKMKKHQDTH